MAHAQEYGIRNPIIEIDIADTSIDWETFNITKLVEMVVFLLTWTQENLYTGKGGAPVPEGEPRPRSMVRTRPKRAPAEVVRGADAGPDTGEHPRLSRGDDLVPGARRGLRLSTGAAPSSDPTDRAAVRGAGALPLRFLRPRPAALLRCWDHAATDAMIWSSG